MTQATRDFDELFTFTRASTATYFDANGVMQTAAIDEPRFDHDPVTGESKGVLVEKESTNLLTYSEAFDNGAWNKVRSSITPNVTSAPDGTSTASKLVENASSDISHLAGQDVSVTSGNLYRFSVFAKPSERTIFALGVFSGASVANGPIFAFFDLTNETVNNVSSDADAKIEKLSDGWYKCSAAFEPTTSSLTVATYLAIGTEFVSGTNNDTQYTGDGTSSIYLWGAQLEQGLIPTSYIPTSGTAVTRSADSLVHDVGVRYNEPEGTWIVKTNSYESTILDNVGFTTAKFTGDGTIVYRYDSTGGYLYANGQKEFNTAKPSTIDTFNIGAGGAYQWTNDLVYYPYAISENDAIALATGSVTVDWFYPDDQSLILDFAQKKYGTRNISDAMDVTETTNYSDLLTFSRASTGRYFDSTGIMQEAAIDELRFDYDANTGEPLGVLIEETRTNLVLLSEDLTTVPWGNYGASISANVTTAPDGAATADKLVEDTADDVHQRGISEVDYTTPMSFSIFAKAAERTQATLICAGIESGIIDLQTGTTSDPDVIITPAGNGWWRLAMTKTPADGTAKVYGIGMAVGGVSSYIGDGSSGIYAWGAQLEEAVSTSSYIPTTGSIASRSRDVMDRNLGSEFNNSDFATIIEYNSITQSPSEDVLMFGSAGDRIDMRANKVILVSTTVTNSSAIAGNGIAGFSVSPSELAYAKNGTSVSSVVTDPIPTMTTLNIASTGTGGSYFNGHIKRIDYIPYALTAAQLETLTT